MSVQYPARMLPTMRERDVKSGSSAIVAVDARTLRRAMLGNPGVSVRALVSLALVVAYPEKFRKVRGK